MSRKRTAAGGDPVERSHLEAIREWANRNDDIVTLTCARYDNRSVRLRQIIQNLPGLGSQAENNPTQWIIPLDALNKAMSENLGENTLHSLAVPVREIILAASEQFPNDLALEAPQGKPYRFYWAQRKGSYYRKAIIIMADWHDEFIDELIRGFIVMGEALGVFPEVHRVSTEREIPQAVGELATHAGRHTSVVIPLGVPGDMLMRINREAHLSSILDKRGIKMPLTDVGYDRATVAINSEALGKQMAKQIRDDAGKEAAEGKRVAVIPTDVDGYGDPYKARRDWLEESLRNWGLTVVPTRWSINRADLLGVASATVSEGTLVPLLRNDPDIVAVYVHTTRMAVGAVHALRVAKREDVRLYADYLSPTTLTMLADERSPMAGVTLVDPYHYGRYALRVAVTRRDEDEAKVRIPVPRILTKKDVLREGETSGLCFMAELMARFPELDLGLEGERYSWEPWMAQRLHGLDGPTLLSVRQRMRELALEKTAKVS
jgi:hypothetical protein